MKLTKLLTALVLISLTEVALGDEPYSFGIGAGVSYVADAKIAPTGKEKTTDYHYHGARAALSIFRPFNREGHNGSLGGYVEKISLQNNFTEAKDPNAEVNKGKTDAQLDKSSHETMDGMGAGAELVSNFRYNAQTVLALGLYQARFEQDGDSPKTQYYDLGGAIRLGIGFGPKMGDSGLAFRIDYQFMVLQSGREQGSSSKKKLYNLSCQNFAPTLSYILGF